jgi:hypothetical protein
MSKILFLLTFYSISAALAVDAIAKLDDPYTR